MTALPPVRIAVGGVDYTNIAQNITWSNADPGGCQTASFDLDAEQAVHINPGDGVRIFDGMDCLWVGRVAEPAKAMQHGWLGRRKVGSGTTSVTCEGAGAVAKDNKMSMIYVDRELSAWSGPTVTRQLNLANINWQLASFEIAADPNSNPALTQIITGAWASPGQPLVESWYDAGAGNAIGQIYYSYVPGPSVGGGAWNAYALLSTDAVATLDTSTSNLATGASSSGYLTNWSQPWRYALLQSYYAATAAGVAGFNYNTFWEKLAVYGPHFLPGRGTDPVGFYVSDIAMHAAKQCLKANPGSFTMGHIDTISNYIVQDYKQKDPVEHEVIIADMAKLGVAHYGWWPSENCLEDKAEFTFRAYTNRPTHLCSLADCNEADLSERLSDLYSSVRVSFSDAAGTPNNVVVTLPNAVLDRVGIWREIDFNLGLSSPAAAQVFGSFALQALYAKARTAGMIELPRSVRDANGALVRSYRLRAGIDRLRINDLPVRDKLLSGDDSFRISRVESRCDSSSGEVMTRVELDSGANLVETLQARFDAATRLGQGG